MNPIHPIRWLAGAVGALVCALLACAATATAALAKIPPPGELEHPAKAALAIPVQTVVSGGMPGWQVTLIAAGAALIAATAAVLLDRARTARRYAITTSA